MKKIILIGAFLLAVVPPEFARAEIQAGSQELGIHAGALFGDDLTEETVSGTQPELGDDFVVGLNYTYNLTRHFGLEGRYTFNPNTAKETPGADIDLDLHLVDVNAVYHVNPHDPFVFYGTAGVGWALSDIDRDISGTVNGTSVTISDDNSITFNAGIGLKWEVTQRISLRVDARYRYIDQVVDIRQDQLNTVETTAGAVWVF